MKVIMIKDHKENKVNDVIEVADGYAKNYLIRNGYAIPYNHATTLARNKSLAVEVEKQKAILAEARAVRDKLENLHLVFKLKVTPDEVIHGSVTRKQVMTELHAHDIKLSPYTMESFQIYTLGLNVVPVKLHPDVTANLKIEVKPDGQ